MSRLHQDAGYSCILFEIRADAGLFARSRVGIRFAVRGQDQEMKGDCFSSGDSIGQLHGPAFPAPGEAGCSAYF
jgi:hypothetical protein